MSTPAFALGQTVLLQYRSRREPVELHARTITKIGKRWVTVSEGVMSVRFDATTLEIDGGDFASLGRVYLDQEHYDTERAKAAAWRALRERLQYGDPPAALTLSDLQRFMAALEAAEEL